MDITTIQIYYNNLNIIHVSILVSIHLHFHQNKQDINQLLFLNFQNLTISSYQFLKTLYQTYYHLFIHKLDLRFI